MFITAGALGIAVGIAETEREDPAPAFADNVWLNLGVASTVVSVLLAAIVLIGIIDRSAYARRIGQQLRRARDIRRRCLASDADAEYDELASAVNEWYSETEIILSRDPAHETEFTRGGYPASDVAGAPSARLGQLVGIIDRRLERLSGIHRSI